jgi:hypothetical protein
MPTAGTQGGSVCPRNLPGAISGQYDESAFLVASNQFGDPWGLNVDGVVSLFVPCHGTSRGSSSSENDSRPRSAAVYTNKDSVMLKIASWTVLFYGLRLLLCCTVHADNAIGVRGPVGCGENPKQVERLEITEPGVYENFLVDSDVLPERVDPGSGSRLRDTGDLSAGGLAVRRGSDRGFARRRRGMVLFQTASDGDQVLHCKVVRIVLEKLKAAGIALDGLTVDNPYEYLIGESLARPRPIV